MTSNSHNPVSLVLHGGSGIIKRSLLSREEEAAFRSALAEARDLGWSLLMDGATALDAVEATARTLEDCPLFNAGRGAVFTSEGGHELDAAIMCGRTRKAGAVCGVRTVRHPVSLARRVMANTGYVFLAGSGAEAFASTTDLERVDPAWFGTAKRKSQLQEARSRSTVGMDHDLGSDTKFGTIGVVALDLHGNLAAATSTGGLTNKEFGRVGDSPLIGAGTFADNRTCAVSCTGYGEEFIRAVVAHDVAARIEYLGESLEEAAREVVQVRLPRLGGSGGLVAVDALGRIAMPFNTDGMYRAWQSSRSGKGVAIFSDESPGE